MKNRRKTEIEAARKEIQQNIEIVRAPAARKLKEKAIRAEAAAETNQDEVLQDNE